MSQTIIVLQDECIVAASGREGRKPQIREIHRAELHGYGDPFARWKDGLKRLREECGLQKVRLILPSSLCTVKSMQLPYAKGKTLDRMAGRELKENFRSGVMDYAVIKSSPEEGVSLVGACVEESVLVKILTLCEELELSVSSISVPMEGIQRVVAEHRESAGQTAIFLFFEEDGLTSVLMEKGQYKYSGRNRLFAEPGTLDFGTEIVRNISGILQFQTASRREERITNLYYAGCPREDFEVVQEEMAGLGLQAEPFRETGFAPGSARASEGYACMGAMMCGIRGRRDMNLLSVYRQGHREPVKKKGMVFRALPVAAVLLVCLAVLAGVWGMNLSVQHRIDKKIAWIESESVQKDYQEAVELLKRAVRIEAEAASVEETTEHLDTYPGLNRKVLARIEQAGGSGITLKIEGYDADTGVLTFQAGSLEVIDIPSYIGELEDTDLFYTVDYTGYTYEGEVYTLSIVCTMAGVEKGGDGQ